jgi:hypothetical protein
MGLTTGAADGSGGPELDSLDDGLTYTFTLRDRCLVGRRFGHAEDFVFGLGSRSATRPSTLSALSDQNAEAITPAARRSRR